MNSGGESAAMSYQDVLLGIKKQRTRVTLHYRIVTITAAYELLGSTKVVYCVLVVKVKEKVYLGPSDRPALEYMSCQFPHFGRSP